MLSFDVARVISVVEIGRVVPWLGNKPMIGLRKFMIKTTLLVPMHFTYQTEVSCFALVILFRVFWTFLLLRVFILLTSQV